MVQRNQRHNAQAPNFRQLGEKTNKTLLQHLLFQMSLLPVCVLSLLPCGAPLSAAVAQEAEAVRLSTAGNSQAAGRA